MKGYVYLIGSERFGWFKIGKTRKPEIRVRDLGILLPFKVRIFAVWKADDHSVLESQLHLAYSEYNINGEWFSFTKEKLRKIVFEDLAYLNRIYTAGDDPISPFARFSNMPDDRGRGNKPFTSLIVCEQRKQMNIAKRRAMLDWLTLHNLPDTRENRILARSSVDLTSTPETDAGHPLSPAVKNGEHQGFSQSRPF